MPPRTNEREIAGPAFSAAACPVRHEEAGADDRADAQHDEVGRGERPFQAVLVALGRLGLESRDRLANPQIGHRSLSLVRVKEVLPGSVVPSGTVGLQVAAGEGRPGRPSRGEADGWTGRLYHTVSFSR